MGARSARFTVRHAGGGGGGTGAKWVLGADKGVAAIPTSVRVPTHTTGGPPGLKQQPVGTSSLAPALQGSPNPTPSATSGLVAAANAGTGSLSTAEWHPARSSGRLYAVP